MWWNTASQGEGGTENECANCGIAFAWAGVDAGDVRYCCAGCAAGGPCVCTYADDSADVAEVAEGESPSPARMESLTLVVQPFVRPDDALAFGSAVEKVPGVYSPALVATSGERAVFHVETPSIVELLQQLRRLPGFTPTITRVEADRIELDVTPKVPASPPVDSVDLTSARADHAPPAGEPAELDSTPTAAQAADSNAPAAIESGIAHDATPSGYDAVMAELADLRAEMKQLVRLMEELKALAEAPVYDDAGDWYAAPHDHEPIPEPAHDQSTALESSPPPTEELHEAVPYSAYWVDSDELPGAFESPPAAALEEPIHQPSMDQSHVDEESEAGVAQEPPTLDVRDEPAYETYQYTPIESAHDADVAAPIAHESIDEAATEFSAARAEGDVDAVAHIDEHAPIGDDEPGEDAHEPATDDEQAVWTMPAPEHGPASGALLSDRFTVIAYPFRGFQPLNAFQRSVRELDGVVEAKVSRFFKGTLHLLVEYNHGVPFPERLKELPVAVRVVEVGHEWIELELAAEDASDDESLAMAQ